MIAPSVAELKLFSAGSENFFGKKEKKGKNVRQCHLNNNNKSHNVRYDTIIKVIITKIKVIKKELFEITTLLP